MSCILLLNKNKIRKRKVIFIYATRDFEHLKNRDRLRKQDIKKIIDAFTDVKEVENYCHIADVDEITDREFKLNVPRYVNIAETEKKINLQKIIDIDKDLKKDDEIFEKKMKFHLIKLKFEVEK